MPRPAAIFINYRTGDGDDVAAHLDTYLSAVFGADQVFRASRSIAAGTDYRGGLLNGVRRACVLVSIIGGDWLRTDEAGVRLVDREEDWIRRELATAFECGVPVIPLLHGGARRLGPETGLPESIRHLIYCQYRRYANGSAEADLAGLAAAITTLVPELTAPSVQPSTVDSGGASVSFTNHAGRNNNIQVGDRYHGQRADR